MNLRGVRNNEIGKRERERVINSSFVRAAFSLREKGKTPLFLLYDYTYFVFFYEFGKYFSFFVRIFFSYK
jgi:hypothetical protein